MPALPEGWQDLTIADICDEIYDGPHATPKKLDEGPIFLSISSLVNGRLVLSESAHLSEEDFIKWTRRITPQEDDLVFSYETRLGEAALIPAGLKCCLGRRMGLIRPYREMVDPQYFLYYFLSPILQSEIRKYTTAGSTVQRLALADVRKFRVLLPPLPEQRAIALILGALDDKIELNRRMNATLESLARAIFKSWFVDFDPVKINAGQMPASSQALAKHDPKVLDLFPSTFQDSELGPIPDGWSVGSIGDIGENPRRTIKPEEIPPVSPYIALEHMPRKSIALGDWDVDEEIKSNKYRFSRGEILFGKLRPYFHKVGVPALDGICSTDILVVIPRHENYFGYLLAHMSSDELVEYTSKTSTGTKMPRTNWRDISAYDIVVPPDDLLTCFDTQVRAITDELRSNIFGAQTLEKLRDTLLPQLLSGELAVPFEVV